MRVLLDFSRHSWPIDGEGRGGRLSIDGSQKDTSVTKVTNNYEGNEQCVYVCVFLLVFWRFTLNFEYHADYIMYSTFLTDSRGSVLFSRSNLLKRNDLCFSCFRIGLIRHRRILRSSHLFSSVCHDFRVIR